MCSMKESANVLYTSSDVALFLCLSSGQISEFSLKENKEGKGGREREQIASKIRMDTR